MHLHRSVLALVLLAACGGHEEDDSTTTTEEPRALGLGDACIQAGPDVCKLGLKCVGFNDCGVGYCSKTCEQDADCDDGLIASCKPFFTETDPILICEYMCNQEGSAVCPWLYAVDMTCDLGRSCVPEQCEYP